VLALEGCKVLHGAIKSSITSEQSTPNNIFLVRAALIWFCLPMLSRCIREFVHVLEGARGLSLTWEVQKGTCFFICLEFATWPSSSACRGRWQGRQNTTPAMGLECLELFWCIRLDIYSLRRFLHLAFCVPHFESSSRKSVYACGIRSGLALLIIVSYFCATRVCLIHLGRIEDMYACTQGLPKRSANCIAIFHSGAMQGPNVITNPSALPRI
jgi:hypothetical protein